MTRTVVVSPHLDDAVLSCGGRLATDPALVVTVFAAVPPEGTPAPVWDRLTGASDPHRRCLDRHAEDDLALSLLGATAARLPLLDGQYRAAPHDHGRTVELLRPLLANADEVWTAAAIGRHADHLAARDATLDAAPPGATLTLFADLPYSLVFGWPRWVDARSGGPLLDAGPWLDFELEAAGLAPEVLTRVPRRLTDAAVARKRAAMAAYTSQLAALDAQSGFRLSDPEVLAFELAWTVARGQRPWRTGWVPGASGQRLPGNQPAQ